MFLDLGELNPKVKTVSDETELIGFSQSAQSLYEENVRWTRYVSVH